MPDERRVRHVIGYLCPSAPDGPIIPPKALTDPCGRDVPVWSDGTLGYGHDGVPIVPEAAK